MSATPGNELPGAFPADTTTTATESSTHNKLHKRDDPRGWTAGDDVTPRTAESGLGSSHTRDASLTAQPTDYTYSGSQNEPTTGTSVSSTDRQAGPGVMTGAHSRVHNQGQPTATEAPGAPQTQDSVSTVKRDTTDETAGLATGHGTASLDNTGNDKTTTSAGSEPYWGDIPRGAGTYNTVVGHGSTEDSAAGHPEHREFPLSSGARHGDSHNAALGGTTSGLSGTQDSSLSSGPTTGQGTYNTVVGHGSNEDDALRTGHQDPTQTSTLGGDTTTTTGTEESQHKDSHTKELAAGAGAAGLGGYAAHKHASKEDETIDPAKTHSHEEKEKKSGGLFHREHKDEPAKHEHVKHEKETTSEKPKEEGEKKFLGLFSRSKKDSEREETQEHPAAAKEDNSHLGRDAAIAGAGATAAAGYAGHKHATKEEERDALEKSDTKDSQESKDKSSSKLHGIFSRGHKETEVPPNAAEYYNGKEAHEVTQQKLRDGKLEESDAVKYGEAAPGETSSNPLTGTQSQSHNTNDKLAYAGTGAAAAGAAAAYGAHEHYEHKSQTQPQPQTSSTSGLTSTPATTTGTGSNLRSTENPSSVTGTHTSATQSTDPYDHLSSGTASGLSTGAQGLGGNTSRAANDPTDQYQHLSSGTASGIAAGTQSSSGAPLTASSSAYSTDTKPHDNNNNLAYAGAGAAGVGAAAYGAHKLHESRDSTQQPLSSDSRTQPLTTEATSTSATATTAPATTTAPSTTQHTTDKPLETGDRNPAVLGALGVGAPGAAYGAQKVEDHHSLPPTTTSSGLDSTSRNAGLTGAGTTASTTTGTDSHLGRSSQDSSKGGQYNVLSSGTPSGINVGDSTTHSHPQQDTLERSAVHDPLTSSSQGTDHSNIAAAGGAAALAGAGAAGYAGTRSKDETIPSSTTAGGSTYDDIVSKAPERQAAAGTTDSDIHGRDLMSGNERKIDTSTDPNAGSAAYDNKPTAPGASSTAGGALAGGLGGAAAGAAASGLSKPVMHTCTECGKDNDISKYFSSEKDVTRH